MVGRGRNVAETDAGEGDAAEIDQVHVDGGGAGHVDPVEAGRIGIDKKLHQEHADFDQQKIAASRGGNDVDVDVARAHQEFHHFPKNETEKQHIGDIEHLHKNLHVPGEGQHQRKTQHQEEQKVPDGVFSPIVFFKYPNTGNAHHQHVDGPYHFGVKRIIAQKDADEQVL